jgi:glucan 1,3-beta-glucosidase
MFENKPDWVVDEWTYGEYMSGQSDTMSEIRRHWDTWFTYNELEK